MAVQRVDAFRVAFDLEYAASLSDADWALLSASPEWHIMTAENSDLLAPVMTRFADKLSVAAQAQPLPVRPIPEGPFQIIGKPTTSVAIRLLGMPYMSDGIAELPLAGVWSLFPINCAIRTASARARNACGSRARSVAPRSRRAAKVWSWDPPGGAGSMVTIAVSPGNEPATSRTLASWCGLGRWAGR